MSTNYLLLVWEPDKSARLMCHLLRQRCGVHLYDG